MKIRKTKPSIPTTQIETIEIGRLNAAPYNPRKITDKARKGLAASITKYGVVEPIIWNRRTGHVVGGHQRLSILQEKGVQEVAVVVVDLPINEEKKLNITLNNPNITGDYIEDELQAMLADIQEEDPIGYMDLHLNDLSSIKIPDAEREVKMSQPEEEESMKVVVKLTFSSVTEFEDWKADYADELTDQGVGVSVSMK